MVLPKAVLTALNIKRLLLSLLTIGVVTSLVFGITQAFFSDTETSQNNILAAGKLDLKIDNTSYLNHAISTTTTWGLKDLTSNDLFFNFTDLKPGDEGEDTISIHVDDNDAWACMEMSLTKDDDNTCTEPELIDDPSCNEPDDDLSDGELGSLLNFIFWTDDGDNVLEEGESVLAEGDTATVLNSNFVLADSNENNVGGIDGDPLTGGRTYYIAKAWCFGTLTPAPLPQDGVNDQLTPANSTGGISCDGDNLDNASQTDQLLADISFNAVQHRNNPNFLCGGQPTPTPSPSPSPTPIACITTYASSSSNNNQGKRKDGSAVLAERSVASAMFGAPQTTGTPSDSGFPTGSFFSLGFTNGNIVVGFASPFFNQPGDDLQVFEVTGGGYPDEIVKVEVGPTAGGPWTVVAAGAIRDESIDIGAAGVLSAQFVRLTDVSNIALFEPTADAYDVDAVKAFCGTQ